MIKPVIAIVGRPNVGKSTLFNRLVGRRFAIVSEVPGTTRDRIALDVAIDGHEAILVDTGGLDPLPADQLRRKVQEQVRAAIQDADLLLLMLDAQDGLLPGDEEVANLVRKARKPTLVVANKVEGRRTRSQALEFHHLGLGEPLCLSAYHGRGVEELIERITDFLPRVPAQPEEEEERLLHLAIVGRPNVGKSLLLNRLLGQERAVVHEAPGTTRDAVDTVLLHEGEPVLLIDTAGIRRSGRVERGIERFSVLRALQAISRADVVALVLDASELAAAQDAHIAGYILEQHKGIMVVVNKWDLAPGVGLTGQEAAEQVRRRLKFLPYVPMLMVSALTQKGTEAILPTARSIFEERLKRISDVELRSVMKTIFAAQPPALRGRRLSLRSVSQVGVNPPTFSLQVNDAKRVHFSYRRYVENCLRQRYAFGGTPIKLIFRSKVKAR